jgi:hypothetical protein
MRDEPDAIKRRDATEVGRMSAGIALRLVEAIWAGVAVHRWRVRTQKRLLQWA